MPSSSPRSGPSAPKPWKQREARTIFVRVPAVDWAAVKLGHKLEFRSKGREQTPVWRVETPTPVVGYRLSNVRTDHDSKLLVLEATWREPLGAISEESLAREGFTGPQAMAHFRRYWMARWKRRFTPMMEVQVYRVRPFTSADVQPLGVKLLGKLYGEFLPS